MNKSQLVDALVERLGDRRTATAAVEGFIETVIATVQGGESVTLTGFGVFEARARAARTARNPRTGEVVPVPAATVPAFRPGVGFKSAVGSVARPAPRRARSTVNGAAVKAAVAPGTTPAAKSSKKAAKPKAETSSSKAKKKPKK